MKNSILSVAHQSAKGLHDAGLLDAQTMRDFNNLCLTPVHDLNPKEIKEIRLREKMRRSVFARYLNISPLEIKKLETGERHPRGAILKLLNIVQEKGLNAIL